MLLNIGYAALYLGIGAMAAFLIYRRRRGFLVAVVSYGISSVVVMCICLVPFFHEIIANGIHFRPSQSALVSFGFIGALIGPGIGLRCAQMRWFK